MIFSSGCLKGLKERDLDKRLRSLESLVYLCLGCWYETAGVQSGRSNENDSKDKTRAADPVDEPTVRRATGSATDARSRALAEQFARSKLQLEWIKKNVAMLFECKGLPAVYQLVRSATTRDCVLGPDMGVTAVQKEAEQRETWCSLAVLYVCLEVARSAGSGDNHVAMRAEILRLEPNLLQYLCSIINNIRWDDSIQLPLVKILLLAWKAILVCLGGLPDVVKVKDSFRSTTDARVIAGPLITASPLDYHSFRQEISSKYPAYNPPPPLFPLEPDSKSMLPPLRVNPTKPATSSILQTPHHGVSILHPACAHRHPGPVSTAFSRW